MPELPEVETIRLKLEPHLVGRTFDRVEIADPRLVRPFEPQAVAAELEGERVSAVERRGKYLVVRFESGRALLIHLRMTGSLLEPGELESYLGQKVGVEPLERRFNARWLAHRLQGRRAPLKAALLDQRTVAGLGNIYVDEALWRARLHPLRPADSLEPDEIARLTRAVKEALRAGVRRQGASLRDYATPDGGRGSMQDRFHVYGRSGEPCHRCGTPIDKIRVGGRGTWYCPQCQGLVGYAASRSASRPSRSSRQSSV
jgi:formamidopyrimidine-DNA glycosylase